MEKAKKALAEFTKERDWQQFHSPQNLAKSISIEAGELLACFQWNDEYDLQELIDELADVTAYCLMLADNLNLDLQEAILQKIEKNKLKYPVNKAKGISTKYNKL